MIVSFGISTLKELEMPGLLIFWKAVCPSLERSQLMARRAALGCGALLIRHTLPLALLSGIPSLKFFGPNQSTGSPCFLATSRPVLLYAVKIEIAYRPDDNQSPIWRSSRLGTISVSPKRRRRNVGPISGW